MSDPNERPAISQAPLSVLLLAQALSTETQDALREWRHFLATLNRPYEIILLQETRPEVAPTAADPAAGPVTPTRTLTYERALGFRDALNEVLRTAAHPLLVFCTADSQYQPTDLERMFKVIDQVDLVVGYRVGKPVPLWRLLLDTVLIVLSRIFIGVSLEPTACWLGAEGRGRRWVARWLFGVRLHDPECSFRLLRREVFQHLQIQARGSFALIEMLAKANHLTCLIAEVPVEWLPLSAPVNEAPTFANDARLVFWEPDFGLAPPSGISHKDREVDTA